MNKVTIPFRPSFREAMLADIKTCTARSRRMADVGDRFLAFGAWFEIDGVTEESLAYVADCWQSEGCTSREHFIEVWNSIHPRRGYDPEEIVYLHRFHRVRRYSHEAA
jgi:hypothetical protein